MWIYKLTNRITGQAYVGATRDMLRRLYLHEHGHGKSSRLISAAIAEYGWSNFAVEVLQDGIATLEVLNQAEREWIARSRSHAHEGGYNLQRGGGHCSRKPTSRVVGLEGRRFGRLIVIGSSVGAGESRKWPCRCDCGATKDIGGRSLRRGHALSCGCLALEVKTANGHRAKSHGMRRTPEYGVWSGMITRCENPNRKAWKDYGGRGISVCQRWRASFANFYTDMGPRPSIHHTLERLNSNGNYEPDNCVWRLRAYQNANRRNIRTVLFDGQSMSVAEAARRAGVAYITMYHRMVR